VSSCAFVGGDAVSDLAQYGATFAVDNSINDVAHRLLPSASPVTVSLRSDATRHTGTYSTCDVVVLEQIHCVVVPNSFDRCP
jgi:hypothetical protein